MRRRPISLAGAFMVAAVVATAQKPAVKLATVAPDGTSVHRTLQAMTQTWKKAGGPDVTIYTGKSMGGEADIVRRMRVGSVDMAMLSCVGLGEIEPSVTALQLMPMAFRSLDEVAYVRERMRPTLEGRLRDKGFVPLFWGDIGWIRFFSKLPLPSANEVKKKNMFVWAGDTEMASIQKASGYRVVPLEISDIVSGLQTGQIEVVAQPPFFALAGQIDRFAPHMLNVNWAPMIGAAVVKKSVWDSMPAAAKASMMEAARKAGDEITLAGRRESDAAVAAMKARGMTVHELSPDMLAGWQKAAEELYPKFRGHTVPAEVFDEVLRLLAEYRGGK